MEKISEALLYDANGFRLYDVDGKALLSSIATGGVYRCYFTTDDGEKAIINQFAAGDMAQCRQSTLKKGFMKMYPTVITGVCSGCRRKLY